MSQNFDDPEVYLSSQLRPVSQAILNDPSPHDIFFSPSSEPDTTSATTTNVPLQGQSTETTTISPQSISQQDPRSHSSTASSSSSQPHHTDLPHQTSRNHKSSKQPLHSSEKVTSSSTPSQSLPANSTTTSSHKSSSATHGQPSIALQVKTLLSDPNTGVATWCKLNNFPAIICEKLEHVTSLELLQFTKQQLMTQLGARHGLLVWTRLYNVSNHLTTELLTAAAFNNSAQPVPTHSSSTTSSLFQQQQQQQQQQEQRAYPTTSSFANDHNATIPSHPHTTNYHGAEPPSSSSAYSSYSATASTTLNNSYNALYDGISQYIPENTGIPSQQTLSSTMFGMSAAAATMAWSIAQKLSLSSLTSIWQQGYSSWAQMWFQKTQETRPNIYALTCQQLGHSLDIDVEMPPPLRDQSYHEHYHSGKESSPTSDKENRGGVALAGNESTNYGATDDDHHNDGKHDDESHELLQYGQNIQPSFCKVGYQSQPGQTGLAASIAASIAEENGTGESNFYDENGKRYPRCCFGCISPGKYECCQPQCGVTLCFDHAVKDLFTGYLYCDTCYQQTYSNNIMKLGNGTYVAENCTIQ